MSKGKIFQGILISVIAIMLFISMSEVSASLNIKSIDFVGSNADLKINVTIENTNTDDVSFNITLKDTTNDEDKQEIYSGELTIDGNSTESYLFGRYGDYDYSLNNNWENYRCGNHEIVAKIDYEGGSDTESNDVDLSADTFSLKFSPDIETGKVSLKDRVYITVKDIDGKAIRGVHVKISDGDVTKDVGTTNRHGEVSFRISEIFSSPSPGTYTLKIFKHEKFRDHYYCDYEKDFDAKKKLKILSITPENPKANESIKLAVSADDDSAIYSGVFLGIENVNDPSDSRYVTLNDYTYYFTLPDPGTYKIHLSKDSDYWDDEKTIVVKENPKLMITYDNIVLGKENEFVVLDENDARVAGARVTLKGEGLNIYKTSDYNGVVKFTITNPGSYQIIAEKKNYQTAQRTFKVLKKLKIAYEPKKPKIYDNVKIKLLDENNSPVDGIIIINNKSYPTHEGYITYNFTKFVNYKIVGKAQKFADVEINLKPLKILYLNINKDEFSVGENLNITLKGDGLGTAKIEIKNLDTNTTKSVIVSTKNYTMPLLIPGDYEITATASGFGDVKKKFSVRYLTMEMNARYDAKSNKILINVTSNGKGLENATISVKTPKNLIGKYTSNANGEVVFDAVCGEGNYTISAEKTYYKPVQQIVEVKKHSNNFGLFIIIIIILLILLVLAFIAFVYKKKRAKKNKDADEIYENKLG